MRYKYIIGSIILAYSFFSCEKIQLDDSALKERSQRLAKNTIIVDTHIDVPYRLYNKYEDISGPTAGNFDYPKARSGGLDVAFMSIYLPAATEKEGRATALADSLIDMVENFTKTWPEKFALARSVSDVTAQFTSKNISLALGMENGAPINGHIKNLAHFYKRGIRYITLTHSKNNHICDSSYDQTITWNGLSPFGEEVVREMNRLGIMIDVSHVSDTTFFQIMRLSSAPVIASHSSCRHFTPGWERNMSDEMIRLLAQNGGVIQINFGSAFINDTYRTTIEPLWIYLDEHNMKYSEQSTKDYIAKFIKEHPVDFAHVSEVVDHIDHVVKIAGIDHVGLGSDFDGVGDSLPTDLKDVSGYPNIIEHLLKRGYSDSDIAKICSGNLLRVWKKVEQIAAGY
jgi:membrane dipeptidase